MSRCPLQPRGWYCSYGRPHTEPVCPLWPRWYVRLAHALTGRWFW